MEATNTEATNVIQSTNTNSYNATAKFGSVYIPVPYPADPADPELVNIIKPYLKCASLAYCCYNETLMVEKVEVFLQIWEEKVKKMNQLFRDIYTVKYHPDYEEDQFQEQLKEACKRGKEFPYDQAKYAQTMLDKLKVLLFDDWDDDVCNELYNRELHERKGKIADKASLLESKLRQMMDTVEDPEWHMPTVYLMWSEELRERCRENDWL